MVKVQKHEFQSPDWTPKDASKNWGDLRIWTDSRNITHLSVLKRDPIYSHTLEIYSFFNGTYPAAAVLKRADATDDRVWDASYVYRNEEKRAVFKTKEEAFNFISNGFDGATLEMVDD